MGIVYHAAFHQEFDNVRQQTHTCTPQDPESPCNMPFVVLCLMDLEAKTELVRIQRHVMSPVFRVTCGPYAHVALIKAEFDRTSWIVISENGRGE